MQARYSVFRVGLCLRIIVCSLYRKYEYGTRFLSLVAIHFEAVNQTSINCVVPHILVVCHGGWQLLIESFWHFRT